MGLYIKVFYNLIFFLFILVCYFIFKSYPRDFHRIKHKSSYQNNEFGPYVFEGKSPNDNDKVENTINIWIIFSKTSENNALINKLRTLLQSIFTHSDGTRLHFNMLSDDASKLIIESIFSVLAKQYVHLESFVYLTFYSLENSAHEIEDITGIMTPHFSSLPGTYYSDALFYISLGLHRLAPQSQKQVILLDCDIVFKASISGLYQQFKKFSSSNLFGMAHELSPVYRHVLSEYRKKHNNTLIGSEPKNGQKNLTKSIDVIDDGYPGLNSGVLLLNLDRIRESSLYTSLLSEESVKNITEKYTFKGHLGDQDYYTLLGFEYPQLFYILDCGWNRQLCKWWRQNEDSSLFDKYYRCDSSILLYHGNCNSHIPSS